MNVAVILAGGQGVRMGGVDKGLLDVGGEQMVNRIYQRLKPQCDKVLISGSHDYGLGLEVISDIDTGPKGPAAGLYAASQNLCGEAGFFTVPVDGPNLPEDLLTRLYQVECSSVACDDNGLHPVFAWWRVADLTEAWRALDVSGSISLNYLARLTGAKRVKWVGGETFRNINTPEDLSNFQNSS